MDCLQAVTTPMDNFFLDLDNFNKLPPVYYLKDIILKLPLNFVLFSLGLMMVILLFFSSGKGPSLLELEKK